MNSFDKRRSNKIGLPPGTLVHIGKSNSKKIFSNIIEYNEEVFVEKKIDSIEKIDYSNLEKVFWVNVDGIHDIELIEKIGTKFNLHPLLLEDIVNAEQRPKIEDYEEYLFIIMKILDYDLEKNEIISDQVSLILGKNYVLSIQEKKWNNFQFIQDRIRTGKGKIRKMCADYLLYTLIDLIVDHYFLVLEKIEEKVEELEKELVTDPNPATLQKIHFLKRDIIILRKSVWPLREIVSNLEKSESVLISQLNNIYFRDVYDHTIHIIDTIETFRDMISGMFDIYLSSISIKLNEVMKILTIISTIFIPLTFIAGVYGMNFRFMPELEWKWGYPVILSLMGFISFFMILYFKRKKWFY